MAEAITRAVLTVERRGAEFAVSLKTTDTAGKTRTLAVPCTREALAAMADAATQLYNGERPQARIDLRKTEAP